MVFLLMISRSVVAQLLAFSRKQSRQISKEDKNGSESKREKCPSRLECHRFCLFKRLKKPYRAQSDVTTTTYNFLARSPCGCASVLLPSNSNCVDTDETIPKCES